MYSNRENGHNSTKKIIIKDKIFQTKNQKKKINSMEQKNIVQIQLGKKIFSPCLDQNEKQCIKDFKQT